PRAPRPRDAGSLRDARPRRRARARAARGERRDAASRPRSPRAGAARAREDPRRARGAGRVENVDAAAAARRARVRHRLVETALERADFVARARSVPREQDVRPAWEDREVWLGGWARAAALIRRLGSRGSAREGVQV